MPNREVHLRRWQVAACFALLTTAFVLAIVLVQRESSIRAEQDAAEAEARSMALAVHTQRVDARLCQGTVENREAVRATWNAARTYILRTSTPEGTLITNEFFDRVLDTIPSLTCVGARPVPTP